MENNSAITCISLQCPFIPYCDKYSEDRTFTEPSCIFAEQIAIRARMYFKQHYVPDLQYNYSPQFSYSSCDTCPNNPANSSYSVKHRVIPICALCP